MDAVVSILKFAGELVGIAADWAGGKPPTAERVEAVWASNEQLKAKILTDLKERERYGG